MTELAEALADLVEQLGPTQSQKVARLLGAAPSWPVALHEALAVPSDPARRLALKRWLEAGAAQELTAATLAMALHGAARTAQRAAERRQLDLVWSGPESRTPPSRLTEQAVAQLIDSAQQELLLVTYTLFRIDSLLPTLEAAVARQVRLTLVLEDLHKPGDMTLATLAQLAQRHPAFRHYYTWPREPHPDGVQNLHVKVLVADRERMLLGSANFTKAAMERNMELGVLIRGGPEPAEVVRHFTALIDQGTLVRQTLPPC